MRFSKAPILPSTSDLWSKIGILLPSKLKKTGAFLENVARSHFGTFYVLNPPTLSSL